MTTKAIFNIDKKLKEQVIRKAKKHGTTFSSVMNFAAKAYLEDRFKVDIIGEMIERGRADVRAGRVYTSEEVYKKLGIKSR
ncbi:hypothetical protein C4568_01075 [Candidatus Parcubacteria bacterium]|nr:MAG: hypothetical protein C4568_01075 [Candidatus Parcubacteria bacterium]